YGGEAAALAWVGDEHGVANFVKVLARRRPFAATLHFLEPFDPVRVGDRKAIAATARERIDAAMRALQ
ncbi:MAG TPA: 1-acyl-sn-glycerol-3-phosphate acyltransferase, partial [Novosphingobium sp.]|nr:1-acyl-sn-glycerol-3-phosphate acyltransferase [Novosphingobium sp.]